MFLQRPDVNLAIMSLSPESYSSRSPAGYIWPRIASGAGTPPLGDTFPDSFERRPYEIRGLSLQLIRQPLQSLNSPPLAELAELPNDRLHYAGIGRIGVGHGCLFGFGEQVEQMLPDVLGIGRWLPYDSLIGESSDCLTYQDRPNWNWVSARPSMGMIGAVGVERVLDRLVSDLAVRRLGIVRVPHPVATPAVLPVEPARSAIVRAAVGHYVEGPQ